MPLYSYARVSTTDQDLTLQETALRAARCGVIRTEKKSGTSREGRTELATLLDFLHAGYTLMVTRVDRLARSIGDLQDVVRGDQQPVPPSPSPSARYPVSSRPSSSLSGLGRGYRRRRQGVTTSRPLSSRAIATSVQQVDGAVPQASPLYADFAGLPAIRLNVGEDKIVLDDPCGYALRAEAVGIDVTLAIWTGMSHVVQVI